MLPGPLEGVGSFAVGPHADGLNMAAFPSGYPVGQVQALLGALPGLVGAGAEHVHIGQTAVGQSKALVQVNGLLKLFLRPVVLGQQQVNAFLPAVGGGGGIGREGHSIAVFDIAWHP